MLKLVQDENVVCVESPFWRVNHRLRSGGVIDGIFITHGSGVNLLAGPIVALADSFSEANETAPSVSIKDDRDKIEILFKGFMKDGHSTPPVFRYEHRYIYTQYYIRNELKITPVSGEANIRHLMATRIPLAKHLDEYCWGSTDFERIKPRYMHLIGSHYEDECGRLTAAGTVCSESRRPWKVDVFKRGKEGICLTCESNQSEWEPVNNGERTSRFSLRMTASGPLVEMSPIAVGEGRHSFRSRKTFAFSWYLMLPNVEATCRKKLFPVFISSTPFPDKTAIRKFAESGVNVVSMMDDVDYARKTIDYWHDGVFPPYPRGKMRLLADLIRNCHAYGIKVTPYFGSILSPEAPVFPGKCRDWYRAPFPDSQIVFHPGALGGTQGALMCCASGWAEFWEAYMKKCVDRLGCDGCYIDYSMPMQCHNRRHAPGEHNGVDSIIGLYENIRKWLGSERILIAHSSAWLFHHNIANQVVSMEGAEGGRRGSKPHESLDASPCTSYMGSGSISLCPNLFAGTPGRKANPLHRCMAHASVLNAWPYPYTFEPYLSCYGHKTLKASIMDPKGFYGMYKKFKGIDFTKYKFHGHGSKAASANHPNLRVSVYEGAKDLVVVAANVGRNKTGRVKIKFALDGKSIPALEIGGIGGFDFLVRKVK